MQEIRFSNFKIAPRLPLGKIAELFKIQRTLAWREYIILNAEHIETILKYKADLKQVYLFEFGCITFVNFNEDEVRSFIRFLELITDKIDYMLFSKLREGHTVELYEDGMCKLWKSSTNKVPYKDYIIPIVSIVLAKSTELYNIELDISKLLDEGEGFIFHLQRGHLHLNTKKLRSVSSSIFRFEFDSVNSIRIFDRSIYERENILSREVYDLVAAYYELSDRFKVVQGKISDLQGILSAYSGLSYNTAENRLFIFEAFLLALFPLSHLAFYLLR